MATNTNFLKDISAIIWDDHIEPLEFEKRWTEVIQNYKLQGNSWFQKKYTERSSWIPAYYRDIQMGGLLRTTSRSESTNSFFGKYLHKNLTLVEFYLCFKTAIKSQRHTRLKLDHETKNSSLELKTPINLEKHAADLFTHTIFKETQDEIQKGMYHCTIESISKNENDKLFIVKDKNCNSKTFEVLLRISDSYINCSCKKYMKVGVLCSHAFHVLNSVEANQIPSSMITKRWLKNGTTMYREEGTSTMDSSLSILNKINSEIRACIMLADNDSQKLDEILGKVKKIKEELTTGEHSGQKTSKTQFFESVIGMETPAEITIKAPQVARTKGCGTRLKSKRELSIEKSKKQKRMCSFCKTMDFHDLRNCPKRKDEAFSEGITDTINDSMTQDGEISLE